MTEFNPDSFLADTGSFNPDAFLAEPDALTTTTASEQTEPGLMQQAFPSATQIAGSPSQADSRNPQAMAMEALKKYGTVGLAGLQDLFSMEQRVAGSYGGGEVTDPEGGYFKEARQATNQFYDDKIKEVEANPYIGDAKKLLYKTGLNLAKQTAEATSQFMEAPATSFFQPAIQLGKTGINVLSKAIPSVKTALLRTADLNTANEAVEALAKNGMGAELIRKYAGESPEAMSVDVMSTIKNIDRNAQEFSQKAIALKQADLEQTAASASPRAGGPVTPYEAGTRLELAQKNTRTNLGKIFQEEQERVLQATGVSEGKLPLTKVPESSFFSRKGADGNTEIVRETGILDASGKPILSKTKAKPQLENPAQAEVQKFLEEIKYNPESGYGEIGNRLIDKQTVSELKNLYFDLGTVKNTHDVLMRRRGIDQKIYDRPITDSKSPDWALKQVRDRLNNVVEGQYKYLIKDKSASDAFSKAWRANNENASTVLNVLGNNLGDLSKLNPEEYIGKINAIGIDNLKKMFKASYKYKELKPVVDELRSGFVDNILARSNKSGVLDYAQLKRNWTGIDPALKKTMMTDNQINQMNHAINRYEKTAIGDPGSISKFFNERNAEKTLENIGTADKVQALRELRFLDDLNGRTGENRLSTKALARFKAKQVGMGKEGRLPLTSDIRTGKFQAMAGFGAGVGGGAGAAIGGPIGAAIGAPIGAGLGVFSQSPAGTVLAFKLLNKIGGYNIKPYQSLGKTASKNILARGTVNQLAPTGTEGY